jgi:hypothetical protein
MANTHSAGAHPDDGAIHHETSDVNIFGILGFGAGLFMAAVVIHFGIWLLFRYFDSREAVRVPVAYPLAATQGTRVPPEPRLQINPREDMRELRSKENELLGSYGWVDQRAGVVRIPISEAMKLTVQRGLPARQEKPK